MPIGFSTATYLAAAAVVAAAAGSYAEVQSSQAQAQSAKFNAQVAANNAEIAQQNATWKAQEGEANAAISQQKTRAEVGAITAAQAANGIDVSSGSAVDVRSSAAELGELSAINIRSNAAREAYGYVTQSASDVGQGQLDTYQAGQAATAGEISASGTLLSAAGKGYSAYSSGGGLGNAGSIGTSAGSYYNNQMAST